MNLIGKRKFIAFLLSIGIFAVLMLIPLLRFDASDLSAYALQLGLGITSVSGAFYADNAAARKVSGKGE